MFTLSFHYTCTRILVCVLIVQYSEETTVYVTNIPFNANEEQLQKIFQEASHMNHMQKVIHNYVHHHYRVEKLKKLDWSETDRADQKDLLILNTAVRYNT